MLEWWNHVSLLVVDGLLGWLLHLSRDAALIGVALFSAFLLTVIRRCSTDQDLLGRIAHDKRRLAELARSATDGEVRARLRATRSEVMLKALRAEGWPLLLSLVPIALLATWCVFRLEAHPPQDGESVVVAIETPFSRVGAPVHLVPQDGLEVEGGYVREIQPVGEGKDMQGLATWTIRGKAAAQPYSLLFRLEQRSYGHALLIGQARYAPPVDVHSDGVITRVVLQPVRLFGIVPGIEALGLQPWLAAYLLLTIPFAVLARRLTSTF
jgi:hypothetical protein